MSWNKYRCKQDGTKIVANRTRDAYELVISNPHFDYEYLDSGSLNSGSPVPVPSSANLNPMASWEFLLEYHVNLLIAKSSPRGSCIESKSTLEKPMLIYWISLPVRWDGTGRSISMVSIIPSQL